MNLRLNFRNGYVVQPDWKQLDVWRVAKTLVARFDGLNNLGHKNGRRKKLRGDLANLQIEKLHGAKFENDQSVDSSNYRGFDHS